MSGVRGFRISKEVRSESYFKNKLQDAMKLGKEWENRDIKCYHWSKQIEKQEQEKRDAEEVVRAVASLPPTAPRIRPKSSYNNRKPMKVYPAPTPDP
jgi:hypothetical protein